MELEIVAPSLFFKAQPSAADALAAEVQAALVSPRPLTEVSQPETGPQQTSA
jgi:hypothetical protein